MKKTSFITSALFAVVFSASVSAECAKPEKPALPDPATAVTPQMVKAKNDVKAFLADAEAYLACGVNTKAHNRMVDEMNEVAAEFNTIVGAFKARVGG